MTICGPLPSNTSMNLDSDVSLDESDLHTSNEPIKITMKTRVAVRDKNSHRFQVIPFRDACKKNASGFAIDATTPFRVPKIPIDYLPTRRPSLRSLSPCPVTELLRSAPSASSLTGNSWKENRCSGDVLDLNVSKTFCLEPGALNAFPSLLSPAMNLRGQDNVSTLREIDANQMTVRSSDQNLDLVHLQQTETLREVSVGNFSLGDPFNESGEPVMYGQPPVRSSHVGFQHDTGHSKSTSLSHLYNQRRSQNNVLSTPKISSSLKSEANVATGESGFSDLRNARLLSPNTRKLVKKPLSEKRHAIYAASLVLPDFDGLTYHGLQPVSSHSSNGRERNVLYAPLQSNLGRSSDSRRRGFEEKTSLQDMQTSFYPPVQNQLGSGIRALSDSLPNGKCYMRKPSVCLSSSLSLTDAKYASLPASLVVNAGYIIYSPIILDLFTQIDRVIEDWN